ncbi:CBS domain-containing protein [Streptomyces sp. 2323.1]|uniref:CBS domain-containing protein n=1 Tax=Streptomyces sp. 2323.1 TaxID=1938841 RepID=UPI000BB95F97|nr:CBS domain-containing protein [Streptomyces sp. 2323.1]SOE09060.1 CBS domain-containing protein [Streptomyces sp. 2323.1]
MLQSYPQGDFPGKAASDVMSSPGPQVGDDMIVDVALSVLIGAGADHLLVRDEDGRCTGLITRYQMTAHHQGPWYTEETRLRDLLYDRGPFTSPLMSAHDAEGAMRQRALRASPVIGEDGHALGVVVLSR